MKVKEQHYKQQQGKIGFELSFEEWLKYSGKQVSNNIDYNFKTGR